MLARGPFVRNIRSVWIKAWPVQGPQQRALDARGVNMSGTRGSDEGLDVRRRRLLYRAWHRGMRETDLITGRFADELIAQMSEDELADFERILEVPDQELLAWVMGAQAVPASHDTFLFRRLRDFSRRVPTVSRPRRSGEGDAD
jgi:antitoxin CptB